MKIASKTSNELIELLLLRYQADPEGLRAYMPEVAQILDSVAPQNLTARSLFGLTEHERTRHQQALEAILEKLDAKTLSTEESVKGLEHCATLIQDDSLPETADYQMLSGLLKIATGKSPSSFKSKARVVLAGNPDAEVGYRVSLIKGVDLELDKDMRLSSVSVSPSKFKERRKMLSFVGKGVDPASDVSARHDDYLAMQEPHAAS